MENPKASNTDNSLILPRDVPKTVSTSSDSKGAAIISEIIRKLKESGVAGQPHNGGGLKKDIDLQNHRKVIHSLIIKRMGTGE